MDAHIGARVRHLREHRGLSRETLAAKFDISHQQFQKYEAGQNRISSGRLLMIARVLDVPISYFYEGLPEPDLSEFAGAMPSTSSAARLLDLTVECFEFLKMFIRLQNPKAKKSVIALVQSLAEKEDTK